MVNKFTLNVDMRHQSESKPATEIAEKTKIENRINSVRLAATAIKNGYINDPIVIH